MRILKVSHQPSVALGHLIAFRYDLPLEPYRQIMTILRDRRCCTPMDHVLSEEQKLVCKNRLSIIDYDTARFGCPSGLGTRAIIIVFIISPVGEVIRSCGLDHHQYADDT